VNENINYFKVSSTTHTHVVHDLANLAILQIDQIVRFVHCGEHFYEMRADWKRSEKHQINYMVELKHTGHRELNHLANMTIASTNGKHDKDFANWKGLCEKKVRVIPLALSFDPSRCLIRM